jgi:hypothetical protein
MVMLHIDLRLFTTTQDPAVPQLLTASKEALQRRMLSNLGSSRADIVDGESRLHSAYS